MIDEELTPTRAKGTLEGSDDVYQENNKFYDTVLGEYDYMAVLLEDFDSITRQPFFINFIQTPLYKKNYAFSVTV